MNPILSSFLNDLRDYLASFPTDHNCQTYTFGYLRAIANACSIEDKEEAEEIKNFLNEEIKPIVKRSQETEYCLEEVCQIENSLDIVIQEMHHSDELLRARQPGNFTTVLNSLTDSLEQLKKGVLTAA